MHYLTTIHPALSRSCFVRFLLLLCFALLFPRASFAAILTIDPPSGSFVVGSTIQVPIWVNSEAEPINAIEIDIAFPPEKLQLVSPSTGHSIITLWTAPPLFNNQKGEVSFQGVIPNGITTSKGLITTLSFRVKSPGKAYVQFKDATKVLKHDGLGTNVLNGKNGAVYYLLLPPPAGPLVASPTHPDPSVTYPSNNIILSWVPEDSTVSEYSYVFTDGPLDVPDDISEGSKTSMMYRGIPDGRHYFHIKSYQNGVWGGVTHFSISIDATPPADFPLKISPKPPIELNKESMLEFGTTDSYSGVDYYEVKVISLERGTKEGTAGTTAADQTLFVEATSPYLLPAFSEPGRHDVIIHAFDRAGNMRESKIELVVVERFLNISTSGVEFVEYALFPWWLIISSLLTLTCLLVGVAYVVRKRHHKIHEQLETGVLPPEIASASENLKEKQKKYTKEYTGITQLVLLPLLLCGSIFTAHPAHADTVKLEPPIISTLSRDIANDEIFYVGGMTALPSAQITIYVENTQTGETFSEQATVDRRGEWFYRHDGFLPAGNYMLWAQESVAGTMSPPSPQEVLLVHRAALQFGFSRLSFAAIYAFTASFLFIIILTLMAYIIFHHREAQRKRARWLLEVKEAEEFTKQGFAMLRRDIEAELSVIRKIKLTGALRAEEVGREQQLMKDLSWVEESLAKEIGDITKAS